MKFGLQTWGSNGDIRPMIALADGLRKAGHEATLTVSSIDNRDYGDLCRELGIGYRQIPATIEFNMPEFAQRTFRMNTLQWVRALLEEVFHPYEREIYRAAQHLAEENDCLIGHHFLYPVKMAAAKQGLPHVSVTFCHAAIPCATLPPFRFPDLGAFVNRLEWEAMNAAFDWALKKRLGRLWFSEGMAGFRHVYPALLTSDRLNLVAVDPVFCPGPSEWVPVHRACGFLNLPAAAESWRMPDSLTRFLEAGDPPVYMTFGSLQQAVADWAMELFVEAAERASVRAVIQSVSPNYPAGIQRGDLYFIGRHPHQPLFRRCAAVVHHGGAGTTHSATLSGCPSVVVPFMDEQLFWGCRLEKLGLGGKPLPADQATASALAGRIAAVVESGRMRNEARRIGGEMGRRDGVSEAVGLIGKILS
ncbi:MAG: glycosyltransferase [Gammaproteobacteria bacterium]